MGNTTAYDAITDTEIKDVVAETLQQYDINYYDIHADQHTTHNRAYCITTQVVVDGDLRNFGIDLQSRDLQQQAATTGMNVNEFIEDAACRLAQTIRAESRTRYWWGKKRATVYTNGRYTAECPVCQTTVELPPALDTSVGRNDEYTEFEQTVLELYLIGKLKHSVGDSCVLHRCMTERLKC